MELDQFLAGIEKRAFRMAEIATGNRDDALDILQEAMCKLVEKYADREPLEWTPLFYSILQSRIRDWYRREKIRNRFRVWFGQKTEDGINPLDGQVDKFSNVPENILHNRQLMNLVGRGIRQLPLRQQQAFMLRILEEFDVKQTANIMGCSEGSVKTHYSRAVHRLRSLLGNTDDEL
jgi:RNA polymerase sigma-70 factor, ECF subfamily